MRGKGPGRAGARPAGGSCSFPHAQSDPGAELETRVGRRLPGLVAYKRLGLRLWGLRLKTGTSKALEPQGPPPRVGVTALSSVPGGPQCNDPS